jgi:hypothetical protein
LIQPLISSCCSLIDTPACLSSLSRLINAWFKLGNKEVEVDFREFIDECVKSFINRVEIRRKETDEKSEEKAYLKVIKVACKCTTKKNYEDIEKRLHPLF